MSEQKQKTEISKIINDFDNSLLSWDEAKDKLITVEEDWIKKINSIDSKIAKFEEVKERLEKKGAEKEVRRRELFQAKFMCVGLFLFGFVGLFFDESRPLSPVLIGFSIAFLGKILMMRKKK